MVPVKKKSKTLPVLPSCRYPATVIVTQLKKPKMKKPMAPPIMSQSGVLNLLKSI